MKKIKLICCDIDGTLIRDDKSLSQENVRWIRKAVDEKEVLFSIVSGRMYTALSHFYDKIHITGFSSCINGTLLMSPDGKVIRNHPINPESAGKVVSVQRKSNVEMLAVEIDEWFTESREGYLYKSKIGIYRKDCHICSFKKNGLGSIHPNKLLFMSPDKEKLIGVENEIKLLLSSPDELTFYSGTDFLEIMPSGINKGTGIDDICGYLGIRHEEVFAIGDDANDIEMFGKVGFPIAMGNALESARKAAKFSTDTNENDGVAKAIQRFLFDLN